MIGELETHRVRVEAPLLWAREAHRAVLLHHVHRLAGSSGAEWVQILLEDGEQDQESRRRSRRTAASPSLARTARTLLNYSFGQPLLGLPLLSLDAASSFQLLDRVVRDGTASVRTPKTR